MPSAAGGWDLGTNYLDAVEQAQEVYDDAVAALESTKTTYGRAVSSTNLPASTSNSAQIGQITYNGFSSPAQAGRRPGAPWSDTA